jgi:hypothetical protein
MKKYYQDWHLKHPSDRDFMHIAQQISGMDLNGFIIIGLTLPKQLITE